MRLIAQTKCWQAAMPIVGVVLAFSASASDAAPESRKPSTVVASTGNLIRHHLGMTAPSGMVVAIDPASGKVGAPSSEQFSRLAARQPSASRPAPVVHPNGSISMDVRGWMREFAVVRRGRDQRLGFGCAENRAAALGIASAPRLSPAREVE